MKESDIEIVETLIQKSLDQQMKMIHLLKPMSEHVNAHSLGAVEKFNTSFSDLQQETKQTDEILVGHLNSEDVPGTIRQLLEQRNSLQKDVMILLKKILPKAVNAKSLMANEVQSIQNGRKALSGYKNHTAHQGKIVNRSS